MAADFAFFSGPWECEDLLSTDSTAVDAGDVLESESGAVNPADSNDAFIGVALESQGASTTSNVLQVLLCYDTATKFLGPREAGTLAAADVGTRIDLNSADGLAADTTTNADFFVRRRLNADYAVGYLTNAAARAIVT